MKNFGIFLIVLLGSGTLSGCYMDSHIGEITSILRSAAGKSTIAVGPSVQYSNIDDTNQYKARSSAGEVTSGISSTDDSVFSAEVSITYQRL